MPKIPDAVLNKLRCANCKCWCSCGPVRVLEDGGTACGRCHLLAPLDEYRHFAYEALSCYFQFPCKYWETHCHEGLAFKDVITHEIECSYSPGCCFCCCHPITACRSKRKLDLDAAIQLEVVPEQILDYLRCNMCAGYLSSTPVLVSKDGTSTCHRCSIRHGLMKTQGYRRHFTFELFAEMMVFPCVFRYEGCTSLFKFGEPMHMHETECLYNTYRCETQQPQQRIYGTKTATAALFELTANKQLEKETFSEEFQKHKELLATKWSQHQEEMAAQENGPSRKSQYSEHLGLGYVMPPQDEVVLKQPVRRSDSLKGKNDFPLTLIDELKIRQSFRMHRLKSCEDNVSVATASSLNSVNETHFHSR